MQECLHSHQKCNPLLSKAEWWPNRLLDVGDSSEDANVKLIITADSRPSGNYMTLSHCWGTAQFANLSISNIDELRSGIGLKTLPKTFREAISVARLFKVSYLWIDSLCIIQDSLEDWNAEASLMSEVYQHALCNIAATGAGNSNGGLFFSRDPRTLQPCKVQLVPEETNNDHLPIRHAYVMDSEDWKNRVDMAPLMKRAWVVQERLLAKRVLHFGKDQLLWECQEKAASEVFPRKVPNVPWPWQSNTKFKDIIPKAFHGFIRAVQDNTEQNIQDEALIWGRILRSYSRGQLTKARDKEVALIGIIRALEKNFNDSTVVGLWKKGMPFQLLWQAQHPSKRSTIYRAPSWSWLSMDGEIRSHVPSAPEHPETFIRVPAIQIEDIKIIRDGSSLLSPIKGGYIRVKGRLKPGTWSDLRGTSWPPLCFNGLDAVQGQGLLSSWLDDTSRGKFPSENIWCLPVEEIYENGKYYSDGLVLKLASRLEGNCICYERVGTYYASGEQNRRLFEKESRSPQQQSKEAEQEKHASQTSREGTDRPSSGKADSPQASNDSSQVENALEGQGGLVEESIIII